MIDPDRVLRPLDEEREAIEGLTTYESPSELASSLRGAWRGVDRSLRQLLRSDSDAPDELRLSALSASDLPYDRLIPALSRRNLVSLRLAGMAHQLMQAAQRAERGDVRAADADAALATIQELRSAVNARVDRPVLEAAHGAVHTRQLEDDAHVVSPVEPSGRRWPFLVGLVVVLALGAVLAALLFRGNGAMADGVGAFDAGRLEVAEANFRRALEADERNVTALLYLGRIYRRQGRYQDAADVLQAAVRVEERDADVRRELGYLFLDLNRAPAAVQQFRQAQELDAENHLNWIGLVRALRAAGDPEAERVLQRAPAEVRAALRSGLLPPDTL